MDVTSPFPGKPAETKPAREWRRFHITLDTEQTSLVGAHFITDYISETIDADYLRWSEGFVTFWEVLDGNEHDHLIIGYPLSRIRQVAEL